MDNLIRITKNITFEDLKLGLKSAIDVYEEQMRSWLFRPIEQLAADKVNTFENGYAMLGLELLFFEPHGKYLSGDTIDKSGDCFRFGLDPFLAYMEQQNLIDPQVLAKLRATNFYRISRCGIFHDLTIKSGLLIDSIHMQETKVFYSNPMSNGLLVSPWNFLVAEKNYFDNYIRELRIDNTTEKYRNFETTFNNLFQY